MIFLFRYFIINILIEEKCKRASFPASFKKLGKYYKTNSMLMLFAGFQRAPPSKYWTRMFSQHRSFPIISNTPTSPHLSDRYAFLTQLNMYNFHKRKTNSGAIEFHHKLFRRNLKYPI
jgi:hypothetical protein